MAISNDKDGSHTIDRDVLEKMLQSMVQDYQDMNPSYVEEVHGHPTPLEFADFVKRNRPAVFRGLGYESNVPALHKWTSSYLCDVLGDKELRIAATPAGNADSIVDGLFVEPEYRSMTMRSFLDRLRPQDGQQAEEDVLYLQSQNDNLADELLDLREDATEGFAFASAVFRSKPEVVNVWIGDERSVTSLHKDPYENLYLVVHGTKTFELLPPTEFYCLHEQIYSCGSYSKAEAGWTIDANGQETPWIPVDPSSPDVSRYPRFKHARPMKATLQRGDVLYLPALWFHKVSQTASADPAVPLAVAINWWYDLAYDSPTWTLSSLVRKLTLALDGRTKEVEDEN